MMVRELAYEEAVMLWKMGMRDLLLQDVWGVAPYWRKRGPFGIEVCPTKLATYGVEIVEE